MMRALDVQVLVLAKRPRAGHVKTRLAVDLGAETAAEVALDALLDTLDAVRASPVARRVLVMDGPPGTWVDGFDLQPQHDGSLDLRLAGAFIDAFSCCPLPALLVGMDTPQLTRALLSEAAARLLAAPSVLGLAADGGFWSLGLHPQPAARVRELLVGVPMSVPTTGAEQRARLDQVDLLPELRDIDVLADLLTVAAAAPSTSRISRWAPAEMSHG